MRIFKTLLCVIVLLLCSMLSVFASPVIIRHADTATLSNIILRYLSVKVPNFSLINSTPNSLTFSGLKENVWTGNVQRVLMFTFVENKDQSITLNANGQFRSAGSPLVGSVGGNLNADEAQQLMLTIKYACDGRYKFGFSWEKKKITDITPNSPASKAGLRIGDKLVSINNNKPTDTAIYEAVGARHITFKIKRKSEEKTIEIDGVYMKSEEVQKELGI